MRDEFDTGGCSFNANLDQLPSLDFDTGVDGDIVLNNWAYIKTDQSTLTSDIQTPVCKSLDQSSA